MIAEILAIDAQIDFCDLPGSALPVAGANADLDRAATMVRRLGKRINDYHLTQDSHCDIDIAHPGMWLDQKGRKPGPYTVITSADIEAGIWRPRNGDIKPSALSGKSLGEYVLYYTRALEAAGDDKLMIWPVHCVIGSRGHTFHENFYNAVREWAIACFATPDIVTKGSNPYTEHYGGLQAEVPLASDPTTSLNTRLIDVLSRCDIVGILGQAGSHCVRRTVDQIVTNIDAKLVSKFHIITDCISPVGHYPPAPNFPAAYAAWLQKMQGLGAVLTTSEKFLK